MKHKFFSINALLFLLIMVSHFKWFQSLEKYFDALSYSGIDIGGRIDCAHRLIDTAAVNTMAASAHNFSKQRYLKSQSAA